MRTNTASFRAANLLIAIWCCSCSSVLRADAVFIPYRIQLSNDFLMGQDSVVVVFQHGKKLQRVKLIRNRRMALKVMHVITCPVGRESLDSFAGQEEIREWNGSTYNFYYPDQDRTVTVASVVSTDHTGRSLTRDSTYFVSLNPVPAPADETEQSRTLINQHVGQMGVFRNVNLPRLLVREPFSDFFVACINDLDATGFTVQELNQLLSLNLPDNGITYVQLYRKGIPYRKIRFFTAFGCVRSVT